MNDKFKSLRNPLGLLWILSIILSIAVRIPALADRSWEWRRLLTELTSYWFQREGLNLLHYQTPLYGPPWQIPFEFPLFQAAAAVVADTGIGDIDLASRLTAMFSYYLAAAFLYLVSRKIFEDSLSPFLITNLFLWTPYNIFYSVLPLIDYLSVALALAYLFFVLVWLNRRSSTWSLGLAILAGSLEMLIKPTTMPIVAVPLLGLVVADVASSYGQDVRASFSLRPFVAHAWRARRDWLLLAATAVIPFTVGTIWTHHADRVKAASMFTSWLTSQNVFTTAYFGTSVQRGDLAVWLGVVDMAVRYLLPNGLLPIAILAVFAVLGAVKSSTPNRQIRVFVVAVFGGIVVTLGVFLNAYSLQYYDIGLSASMAILGGYGIVTFWRVRHEMGSSFKYVFAFLLLLFVLGNAKEYQSFRAEAEYEDRMRAAAVPWTARVQEYVAPDKWVVVVESDWNPIIPFILERKTMVVTPRESHVPICTMLVDPHFVLVVVPDPNYTNNVDRVLRCFKSQTEVMQGVYLVDH